MERRLFFLIHRAQRALFAYASAGLDEELGLSVAQLTTLMYVAKHAGCSLTELADLLDLNKSAVTGLVQRMERAGTLRREANPDDARGSRLYVTSRGDDLRARAAPLVRRLQAELATGFDEKEMETVMRFLNTVVERFSDDQRAGGS